MLYIADLATVRTLLCKSNLKMANDILKKETVSIYSELNIFIFLSFGKWLLFSVENIDI